MAVGGEETEQVGQQLVELQFLEQEARATVGLSHQRAMAAHDIGLGGEEELMFCDDMLADAEDWSQACSWVLREAHAELGVGEPELRLRLWLRLKLRVRWRLRRG
eukprot:SAG31_NODE_543_length_14248_cov_3.230900_8_plen_105_part_00